MYSSPDIIGVLLVAGQARRMGQAKALMPMAGLPLCVHAVRSLGAVCGELLVVLPGGDPESEQRALHMRAVLSELNVPIQYHTNPAPARGLMSSFQVAARALASQQNPARAAIFALADMPLVSVQTHQALAQAFLETHSKAVICDYAGVSAPPLLLDLKTAARLLTLPDADEGPRTLLKELGQAARKIARPAHELLDIDTPADLARAEEFLQTNPDLNPSIRK